MLSNCGEEATIVDIMSVTRTLLEDRLDDAIDMVPSQSFPPRQCLFPRF
jgi:hypothetical protein